MRPRRWRSSAMWPTPAASAPRTPRAGDVARRPRATCPATGDAQPGDRLDELGLAVAVDARDADDLAGAHLQREPAHARAARGRRRRLEVRRPRAAARRRVPRPSRPGTARRGPTISLARLASVAPSVSTVSTFLPRRSTVTRSAISSTSRSLCEMKMTETPSAVSARSTLNSSAVSCAVSTAVGSSRISTSAPRCSTRRISTRCCWPTPMSSTQARGSTARPKRSDSSRTRCLGGVDGRAARPCAARTPARRSRPPS